MSLIAVGAKDTNKIASQCPYIYSSTYFFFYKSYFSYMHTKQILSNCNILLGILLWIFNLRNIKGRRMN